MQSHAPSLLAKSLQGHSPSTLRSRDARPLGSQTYFRVGTALAILVASTAALAGASGETFQATMASAMLRMHREMAVATSGNADRDFAAMMIPHHRGAIEMAELQLLHGSDERLRRLAQGIIVEQSQEIAAMRHVLADIDARGSQAKRGLAEATDRRYLVVAPGTPAALGQPVQVQGRDR